MKWNRLLILACVQCLFSFQFLAAESSPTDTVRSMLAAMKKTGSPVALADFVHWETAFQSLEQEERDALQITSPEELKAFYEKTMTNPVAAMHDAVKTKLESLPTEKRKALEQQLERGYELARQKVEDRRARITSSSYTVDGESIDGNQATVQVTARFEANGAKKTKVDYVELQRFNGRWLLSGLRFLQTQGR